MSYGAIHSKILFDRSAHSTFAGSVGVSILAQIAISLLSARYLPFFCSFISSRQVSTFRLKDNCVQVAGRHAAVSPDCAAGLLRLVAACCAVSVVVAALRMVLAPFCAQLRTLFLSCVSASFTVFSGM